MNAYMVTFHGCDPCVAAAESAWKAVEVVLAAFNRPEELDGAEPFTFEQLELLQDLGEWVDDARDIPHQGSGAAAITRERIRQVDVEGWRPEHDDGHDGGELAHAAAAYLLWNSKWGERLGDLWPFSSSWFKPGRAHGLEDRIRRLEKAGALVAAEIDRLRRIP